MRDSVPGSTSQNREGHCVLCGAELGWYDSKFVEIDGERLACAECLNVNNSHWPPGYKYWTDG